MLLPEKNWHCQIKTGTARLKVTDRKKWHCQIKSDCQKKIGTTRLKVTLSEKNWYCQIKSDTASLKVALPKKKNGIATLKLALLAMVIVRQKCKITIIKIFGKLRW